MDVGAGGVDEVAVDVDVCEELDVDVGAGVVVDAGALSVDEDDCVRESAGGEDAAADVGADAALTAVGMPVQNLTSVEALPCAQVLCAIHISTLRLQSTLPKQTPIIHPLLPVEEVRLPYLF